MVLKEKGRYYELPIVGSKLFEVVYSGIIRLVFASDEYNMSLELLGKFELKKSDFSTVISSRDKETLIMFYDLLNAGVIVSGAKMDKKGHLFLTFSNREELLINNGSCDEWYFHVKDKYTGYNSLTINGGMGFLDH
jgi:hypothetical protein